MSTSTKYEQIGLFILLCWPFNPWPNVFCPAQFLSFVSMGFLSVAFFVQYPYGSWGHC